ncbi:MAG: nickel pincer cofactor biosynthesis protein LarC [Magnetococcales bacterium]|nr:nickel pincer cofactor biosynthesis protein LarC [Magnetococcales bacterium]
MRIHLDPVSGIAGDMFIAGCLDLGLDREALVEALGTLDLAPWRLDVTRLRRGGMSGLHVAFLLSGEEGHSHPAAAHDHHHHRHLADILALISRSGLPERVKEDAAAMFSLLAEVEGKVHGIDPEEVHFHEVGAEDAILDVCGAAFAVWRLGVTEVTASPVAVGSGMVRCAHGSMPVPVPAVAELFRRFRVPLQVEMEGAVGELTTPTGAVILVHFARRFGPSMLTTIDRCGLGLGTRELPGRTNGLRMLAQESSPAIGGGLDRDRVTLITANIDDMNPEWFGPLWDRLFEAGALDVSLSGVTMKKGRPGVRLECMVAMDRAAELARVILEHSTTLGVRMQPCDRFLWPRTEKNVATPWGEIGVKVAAGRCKAEHDDLLRLARKMGWSLPETALRIAPFLIEAQPSREGIAS